MKEQKVIKVSPRQLFQRPFHTKSKSHFHGDNDKLIEQRTEISQKKRPHHERHTQMSEEIVYCYDEDDFESELKIKSMIDLNDTTEVTSSSEIPTTSNKGYESKPKSPYLYQMRSRHMHYMNRDSYSTSKLEVAKESNPKKTKNFKVKKGNILKQVLKKDRTCMIGMYCPTEYYQVGAISTKPESKEIDDSFINMSQTESYDLSPKTMLDTFDNNNVSRHKRSHAIEVCFWIVFNDCNN